MIDKSRPAAEPAASPDPDATPGATRAARAAPGTLPGFAPVPRRHQRHDGWTPDRQHRFIAALADLGSVRAAAHAVNMTPEGAYQLRRHAQAGGFRRAWEAALALGVQRLEDVAMERALHGVEVPVYHFGAVVGTRRVHNDRLLMFLLRNRAPKRFAADSLHRLDAARAGQFARLKAQWRREWEAERAAAEAEDDDAALAALDAKFAQMIARAAPPGEVWNDETGRYETPPRLPAPGEDDAAPDDDAPYEHGPDADGPAAHGRGDRA